MKRYIAALLLLTGVARGAADYEVTADSQFPNELEDITSLYYGDVGTLQVNFQRNGVDYNVANTYTGTVWYSTNRLQQSAIASITGPGTGTNFITFSFGTGFTTTNGQFTYGISISDGTSVKNFGHATIYIDENPFSGSPTALRTGNAISYVSVTNYSGVAGSGPYRAGTNVTFDSNSDGSQNINVANTSLAIGGDVTGTVAAATVVGIRSVAVTNDTSPTDDYILRYDAALARWNYEAFVLTPWTENVNAARYSLTNQAPADFAPTSGITHKEGRIYYNEDTDTFNAMNAESDVEMNIGEELWIYVRNNSGNTITNGKVVYISGATGQTPTIALAKADATATARAIALATHDIENNSFGYVTSFGSVRDADTTGGTDGDTIYLSAATDGEWTTNAPADPNFTVCLGTIAYSHASNGKILVRIRDAVSINEVQGLTAALANYLRVDGANSPTASIDWDSQNITDIGNLYWVAALGTEIGYNGGGRLVWSDAAKDTITLTSADVNGGGNSISNALFVGDGSSITNIDHGGLEGLTDVADHPGYLQTAGGNSPTASIDWDSQNIIGLGNAYFTAASGTAIGYNGGGRFVWTDDTKDYITLTSADLNAGGNTITNGADGTAANDYMTKGYIDDPQTNTLSVNGFANRTSTELSFTNSTRTVTLAPTATDYDYWYGGVHYGSVATKSVVISDTEGLHYIYIAANGTLTDSTSLSTEDYIKTHTAVALVYWDATNNQEVYFGDERHGINMSSGTHYYEHDTRGAVYDSGLGLSGFSVDGSGNANASAWFTVASGDIHDEDLDHDISSTVTGNTWDVYYYTNSTWRIQTNTAPVASTDLGTDRLAYNNVSQGSLVEVSNNDFVLAHIFANNDTNRQLAAFCGQADYANIISARQGAVNEINTLLTTGLPMAEAVPIATIIYQTSDGYLNSYKARIRTTDEGDNYVDWRGTDIGPGANPSEHGNLTGLDEDDHPQYFRTDGTRTMTGDINGGANVLTNTLAHVFTTNTPTAGQVAKWDTANERWYAANDNNSGSGSIDPEYLGANDFTFVPGAGLTTNSAVGSRVVSTTSGGTNVLFGRGLWRADSTQHDSEYNFYYHPINSGVNTNTIYYFGDSTQSTNCKFQVRLYSGSALLHNSGDISVSAADTLESTSIVYTTSVSVIQGRLIGYSQLSNAVYFARYESP
jgi:hypothetical protein